MKRFTQKIAAIVSTISIGLTLVGISTNQGIAKDKTRKSVKVRAGNNATIAMSLAGGTANKARLQADRKKVAGAEAFSIDIGTSENLKSLTGSERRKVTKRTRQ